MERSLTHVCRAAVVGTVAVALASALVPAAGASGAAARVSSNAPQCVPGTSYDASVSGSDIASVTFALDGRRLATVHGKNSHGAFAKRVHLSAGRAHMLTMTVDFTSQGAVAPQVFHRTLARCAAKIRNKKGTTPTTGTSPSSETEAQTLPSFTG